MDHCSHHHPVRPGRPAEKVNALDVGADDYLTKPFGMDELLARVRAALRRAQPDPQAPVVTTDAFTIDLAAKRASRQGTPVRLTPTEWHLIEILIRHPGQLVTGSQLLTEVWGPGREKDTNYLRVYMGQLRSKLETTPPSLATSSPNPASGTASTRRSNLVPRLACFPPPQRAGWATSLTHPY